MSGSRQPPHLQPAAGWHASAAPWKSVAHWPAPTACWSADAWPPGLEKLTQLKCLWIVHQVGAWRLLPRLCLAVLLLPIGTAAAHNCPASSPRRSLPRGPCPVAAPQAPLILPTSLSGSLEGIHVMARGLSEERRAAQRWDWLAPFSKLTSVRLQVGRAAGRKAQGPGTRRVAGCCIAPPHCSTAPSCLHCLRELQGLGMREVPAELRDKSHLTRLDLMCNQIEASWGSDVMPPTRTCHSAALLTPPYTCPRTCRALQTLPPGPYLANVRCSHLGNNCLSAFPSALLAATQAGPRRPTCPGCCALFFSC